MADELTLYHGSERVLQVPEFGWGRASNDFGLGFYCTKDVELAKEWAVSSLGNGYANRYSLSLGGLNVLNLNTPQFSILNWIAVLLRHRVFTIKTPIARRARQYLLDNFYVPVEAYDIAVGYRADDSYFDYAAAFVSNALSVDQLAHAMRLGRLGEQIVLKSRDAFSSLRFQDAVPVAKDVYFPLRRARSDAADRDYRRMIDADDDGLYVRDILKGGIRNDDPRLPRNLP